MAKRRRQDNQDLTRLYRSGELEEQGVDSEERYDGRRSSARKRKLRETAELRSKQPDDFDDLPEGEVVLVYSLYVEVHVDAQVYLCTVRKTLQKIHKTQIVVGDRVRIRPSGATDEQGRPEAVIEHVLDRRTVLTRADSFLSHEARPIVANAQQMLIVASLVHPIPKWGLVDRMLIGAESGGLEPIVCLNKMDLARESSEAIEQHARADDVLSHYESLGIRTVRTSVSNGLGIEVLRDLLRNRVTVLAGHSGAGKSSLIRAVEPGLDIRVGEISTYNEKGRHTTTSARRYELQHGGYVVDTPGVKVFGLWNITRENVVDFFPDVAQGNAPDWRAESYERIVESLPDEGW